MNFYKKTVLFCTILLSCLLCSCSSKTDNLKSNFINYYDKQLNNNTFITSTNKKMVIINLQKEDNSSSPKVVLTLEIGGESSTNEETYQWLQLSIDERKSELKECGDMVVNYAKNNNWSNNYYLYVNVSQVYDGNSIVYDYEQNTIWIPDCEDVFFKMYNNFNTFNKKELEKTQKGIDFLIENNLGYLKHNQIEYYHVFAYNVYIQNGEFNSYGRDNSSVY